MTRERLVPKCDFSLNEIRNGTLLVQFSPCTVALSLEFTCGARISTYLTYCLYQQLNYYFEGEKQITSKLINQMKLPNQLRPDITTQCQF